MPSHGFHCFNPTRSAMRCNMPRELDVVPSGREQGKHLNPNVSGLPDTSWLWCRQAITHPGHLYHYAVHHECSHLHVHNTSDRVGLCVCAPSCIWCVYISVFPCVSPCKSAWACVGCRSWGQMFSIFVFLIKENVLLELAYRLTSVVQSYGWKFDSRDLVLERGQECCIWRALSEFFISLPGSRKGKSPWAWLELLKPQSLLTLSDRITPIQPYLA